MNALPHEVPVLRAKDICRETMNGPNGTHCLMAWLDRCRSSELWDRFREAAGLIAVGSIVRFNDDTRNSKAKIANVWNKAMPTLGYVKRGRKFVRPVI